MPLNAGINPRMYDRSLSVNLLASIAFNWWKSSFLSLKNAASDSFFWVKFLFLNPSILQYEWDYEKVEKTF